MPRWTTADPASGGADAPSGGRGPPPVRSPPGRPRVQRRVQRAHAGARPSARTTGSRPGPHCAARPPAGARSASPPYGPPGPKWPAVRRARPAGRPGWRRGPGPGRPGPDGPAPSGPNPLRRPADGGCGHRRPVDEHVRPSGDGGQQHQPCPAASTVQDATPAWPRPPRAAAPPGPGHPVPRGDRAALGHPRRGGASVTGRRALVRRRRRRPLLPRREASPRRRRGRAPPARLRALMYGRRDDASRGAGAAAPGGEHDPWPAGAAEPFRDARPTIQPYGGHRPLAGRSVRLHLGRRRLPRPRRGSRARRWRHTACARGALA